MHGWPVSTCAPLQAGCHGYWSVNMVLEMGLICKVILLKW